MRKIRLNVKTKSKIYPIIIGKNIITQIPNILKSNNINFEKSLIVVDSKIPKKKLNILKKKIVSKKTIILFLNASEKNKNLKSVNLILNKLFKFNFNRNDCIISFGGGIVGDVSGFAASIFKRGLKFVNIPTTLLAQVDSSVGGKTGIDTRQGKNLVGAFHQPLCVIADTATLDTLPARERRCGYAEVIKYGIINDRPFFDWLIANGQRVLDGDPDARREAVIRSCKSKASIVAADEKEAGLRALLNLGHTFAHAIEAQVGFDDALKHGEAVAIGMVMALNMSARLAVAPESAHDALKDHLDMLGLPTTLTGLVGDNWTSAALLDHMARDKKTEGGKLTFILAHDIGNSFVAHDVDPSVVAATLDEFITDAKTA